MRITMRLIKTNPPITQILAKNPYTIDLMKNSSEFIFVKETSRGSTFTFNGEIGRVENKLDELAFQCDCARHGI